MGEIIHDIPSRPRAQRVPGMTRLWRRFLAYWRLDLGAVCEMSHGKGEADDYHDWPDSFLGAPAHMYTHHCRRCGKAFII